MLAETSCSVLMTISDSPEALKHCLSFLQVWGNPLEQDGASPGLPGFYVVACEKRSILFNPRLRRKMEIERGKE